MIRVPTSVRRLTAGVVVAAAGFMFLGMPLVAHAEVSGPGCTAHLAGVDVAGVNSQDQNTAIHVQKTDTIAVDLSGEPGQTGVHVDYRLVGDASIGKDGSGTQYAARVSDYVNLTGLYLVQARSVPAGCSAAALVQVDGNPLSTLIGDGALGAAALGTAMVAVGGALAAFQGGGGEASPTGAASPTPEDQPSAPSHGDYPRAWGSSGEETEKAMGWKPGTCALVLPMALVMTTLAMTGALPGPMPVAAGVRRPQRVRWRPRLSILGLLGGIFGSAGAVVLMELNGNVYPTRRWTIEALVGGLVAGLVIPSLGNAVAVWRVNRRRAARVASRPAATAAAVAVPAPAVIPAAPAAAPAAAPPPEPAAPPQQPAPSPAAPPVTRTSSLMLGATPPLAATPGATAWRATHRVPAGGMQTWPSASPDEPAGAWLDAGLTVQVTEERGEWARILCDNGWTAWVDRRRLETLG